MGSKLLMDTKFGNIKLNLIKRKKIIQKLTGIKTKTTAEIDGDKIKFLGLQRFKEYGPIESQGIKINEFFELDFEKWFNETTFLQKEIKAFDKNLIADLGPYPFIYFLDQFGFKEGLKEKISNTNYYFAQLERSFYNLMGKSVESELKGDSFRPVIKDFDPDVNNIKSLINPNLSKGMVLRTNSIRIKPFKEGEDVNTFVFKSTKLIKNPRKLKSLLNYLNKLSREEFEDSLKQKKINYGRRSLKADMPNVLRTVPHKLGLKVVKGGLEPEHEILPDSPLLIEARRESLVARPDRNVYFYFFRKFDGELSIEKEPFIYYKNLRLKVRPFMDDIRDLKLFLLLSKNETLLKENSVEKFLHQAIIDYNCLLGKLIFLKEMKRIINPMGWFKRIIRSKEVIGSFNKLFIFPEIWSVKERKSIRKLGLFHEDLTFLFSQNLIEGPFLEYYNKFYFDGEGEGGVIMRLSKNIIRGLDAKRLYYEVDDEFSKVFIEQIKINDDFKKVLFHSFFQSLIYFWQKIIPKLKFLRFSYNATREYFINKGMQTKVFDKPSDLDFRKQNDCLDVMTLLLSLDESKIPNYLINTRIRDLLQKRSAAVAAANPEQVRVLDKELKINSDPELKKNLRQTFFPKH